jgi:hypothetical protein
MTTAVATSVGHEEALVPSERVEHDPRWPRVVFWTGLAIGLPLILWFGRDHWFFFDEWLLLVRDGLTTPGYLDGHNGHWITVLVVEYRLNFHVWGLNTYLPYQVPVVLAHLGTAVLLRAVMRRAGVRGWIATVAALAFVYFGSGRDNITYGFQLSLTGSLLVGIALMLLADRPERRVTTQDWLGLPLGLVGLMTSSVFVAALVGLGVVLLVRRGPRVTAFYLVPLGAVYAAWYLRYGGDSSESTRLSWRTARFVLRMFGSVFEALAQTGIGGALLVLLGGMGLVLTIRRGLRVGFTDHGGPVVGLAVAWVVFAGLTSLARAHGAFTADSHGTGRYLHVGAALFLPSVAVGIEQLARRRALLGVAAVLVLASGLPGNLDRLARTDPIFLSNPELFGADSRPILEAMAHSPLLDDVPSDHVPVNGAFDELDLTVGWLRRSAAAGRIPEPESVDPQVALTATSYLVLTQRTGSDQAAGCPAAAEPVRQVLGPGDQLGFEGAIAVAITDGEDESRPRELRSTDGSVLRALAGPVDVMVRGVGEAPRVCLPARGT